MKKDSLVLKNLIEALENNYECIDFTSFYNYKEFIENESTNGFEFGDYYYEIQGSWTDLNYFDVLRWNKRSGITDIGYILEEKEIIDLTNNINKLIYVTI